MKIIGFITEYNPFHNGHLYHMEHSKELTGADFCIALMSGSYVQRGEPALFDKYARTAMALQAGVDLVLELPVSFSTASAMEFASFGVALFTALGSVDSLCFGSECGRQEPLRKAARLLAEEPLELKEALFCGLKEGMTYPKARTRALQQICPSLLTENNGQLLLSPNNLLGIEYMRAGLMQNSPLHFVTFRREGSGYHETGLTDSSLLPSASALRHAIKSQIAPDCKCMAEDSNLTPSGHTAEGNSLTPSGHISLMEALKTWIPPASLQVLRGETPVFADDLSPLLNYRILNGTWEDIADLSPELEARIRKNALPPTSFTERIHALKSRQLTYTRVSRALLHLVLELHGEEITGWKQAGYAPYARILGFRKKSAPLLRHLKKTSAIPLITRAADAKRILSPSALSMLEQEIRAAHLYQMIKQERGGVFRNEYRQGVLIL